MSTTLKLGLLENSHAFLAEAASNAVAAAEDSRAWQFAILHVAQSLELSLKALLNSVHPAFVFRNVDRQRETVGTLDALNRLQNPSIGGIDFSPRETARIQSLVAIRNRITHSEFELRPEHAAAKFFEMFAFVADFQARHLGSEIESVIPGPVLAEVLRAEKAVRELAARALLRIEEEGISDDLVWICPECGKNTFVIQDSINTCFTCRLQIAVATCPHCEREFFEEDLIDFTQQLEWDCGEGGSAELHDDYGYRDWFACPECLPRIEEDIQQQQYDKEDYYRRLEEEYQRRRTPRRRPAR
mgnify:CR=1 FL=1